MFVSSSTTMLLVPILKDTWGKEAGDSIRYYSELEDESAGTTSLGIPNIESGRYNISYKCIVQYL